MNDFINSLHVDEKIIFGKPESKVHRYLDVYRNHVGENLPGFIEFMETINEAISSLEDNMVVSNIQFKTRIKDAIGTVRNTGKKQLDDIFGFEIIAPNELSKEILMLLVHRIYDEKFCHRTNNLNKSNGYVAHHRVGAVKEQFTGKEFEDLESYILEEKTPRLKHEYRDLVRGIINQIPIEERDEFYEDIYLYPILREKIIKDGKLSDSLLEAIQEAGNILMTRLEYFGIKDIPAVEVQFKTAAVAEEAIFGTASHVSYKPVNENEVIDDFKKQNLIRGMNFPFKFHRVNGKMKLQDSGTTLLEIYPFLRELIRDFKRSEQTPVTTYDMHFAILFPVLRKYVKEEAKKEPYYSTKNASKEKLWKFLKLRTLYPSLGHPTEQDKTIKKEGEAK